VIRMLHCVLSDERGGSVGEVCSELPIERMVWLSWMSWRRDCSRARRSELESWTDMVEWLLEDLRSCERFIAI